MSGHHLDFAYRDRLTIRAKGTREFDSVSGMFLQIAEVLISDLTDFTFADEYIFFAGFNAVLNASATHMGRPAHASADLSRPGLLGGETHSASDQYSQGNPKTSLHHKNDSFHLKTVRCEARAMDDVHHQVMEGSNARAVQLSSAFGGPSLIQTV
jgi:hypothetical protein